MRRIIVPKLDDLKVKDILAMVKNDMDIRSFMPDEVFDKMTPDRMFFFDTVNTIHPGFLDQLI